MRARVLCFCEGVGKVWDIDDGASPSEFFSIHSRHISHGLKGNSGPLNYDSSDGSDGLFGSIVVIYFINYQIIASSRLYFI